MSYLGKPPPLAPLPPGTQFGATILAEGAAWTKHPPARHCVVDVIGGGPGGHGGGATWAKDLPLVCVKDDRQFDGGLDLPLGITWFDEAAPLTTSDLEYLDELLRPPDPRSAILARAISQPRDCDGPRLARLYGPEEK